jgi:hypothetical protein
LIENYHETRKRFSVRESSRTNSQNHSRIDENVVVIFDSEDCDDTKGSDLARVTRANPPIQNKKDSQSNTSQNNPPPTNNYVAKGSQQTSVDKTQIDLLTKITETIAAEFDKFSKRPNNQRQNQANKQNQLMNQNQSRPNSNNNEARNSQPDRRACYKCGIVGHIAQFCESFHKMMGTLENYPGVMSQQTHTLTNQASNQNNPSQNWSQTNNGNNPSQTNGNTYYEISQTRSG